MLHWDGADDAVTAEGRVYSLTSGGKWWLVLVYDKAADKRPSRVLTPRWPRTKLRAKAAAERDARV